MAQPDQPTLTLVTLFCLFCMSRGWSPEIQGREGGAVELDCSLPGPSSTGAASTSRHVVEWVRRGSDIPVLISFGAYASRVHPKYEGRVTLVRSTSLRVERLMVEDEGAYECQLFLLDHGSNVSRNGNWTQLSVTAPPTFIKTPPSVVEALAGSRLSLSCVAKGNPIPSITWLKDGAGLRDQGLEIQGGTLLLGAVTPELRGQYGCRASNPDGNITHVTTLQVKGPPVIVIPPKSTSLNMSQNADLKCKAIADPPNMTYVWRKGRENVHHIESLKSRVKIMVDGSLHISTLTPEDSGKYTCMPTNGLLAPPTASADLTVMHPAQALPMPRETYLPTGMRGLITCPFLANPPLLHVDWTKDGTPLDVTLYPGWTMTSEGSLSMATVNEDSAGMYTCTPTNSFGSMGTSGVTQVLLQGPPLFRSSPQHQYQQEMGRALLIPCQGEGGPDTRVTWRKVIEGPGAPIFQVTGNGSLLLQPLTKGHQGAWQCSVSNRVASVSASTLVLVLGTTPHAATSLSVAPGPWIANVSWEPGYDGGSAQIFSVWFKQISPLNSNNQHDNNSSDQKKKRQHQGWFNVSVPPSAGPHHQVTGLSPATRYQFSVLAQNAAGAGPFSELVTVRTLDAPIPRRAMLSPPGALSVNLTSTGVILHWAPPPGNRPPITALVLQSRSENGEWLTLDRDINAAAAEVAVPGLRKDSVYELRLLSRRGEVLSEPSPSVNVSTLGLGMIRAPSQLSEFVPQSLLAGILGGVVFMALVLFLLLAATCLIARRRDKRRQKQLNKEDLVRAIYKCPSMRTPGNGSPDSVLKKSLLRSHNLYPTTSSSTSSSSSSSASSSQSHNGYFSEGSPPDNQDQHMELLPGSHHPHHPHPHHHQHHHHQHHLPNHPTPQRRTNTLTRAASAIISSHLELISRGPDGRFAAPADGQSLSSTLDDEKAALGRGGRSSRAATFQRSASLPSRRGGEAGRRAPCVLSVDLPPCRPPGATARRPRSMTEQHLLSLQGRYPSDDKTIDRGGRSDWRSSLRGSVASPLTAGADSSPPYAVIKQAGPPRTTASTLVLQMEHERERGNLSRCLQLAQEREALQWELRKYSLERGGAGDGEDAGGGDLVSLGAGHDEGRVWLEKSGGDHLHRLHRGSRGSCDLASLSHAWWGASPPPLGPMSASVPRLSPSQGPPQGNSFRGSMAQFPVVSPATKQDAADRRSTDRFTLPHLSAEHRWHPQGEVGPEGHYNSLRCQRDTRPRNDPSPEAGRRRNPSTPSSVRDNKYAEHFDAAVGDPPRHPKARTAVPEAAPTHTDDTCVEMSVDGPELEITPSEESRAQRGDTSSLRRQPKGVRDRGSRRLTPLPGHSFEVTPRAPASRPHGRHPWKTMSLGSDACDYHQRSHSLDHRKHRQAKFLTPDAWVDSLSQENCSAPLARRTDSLPRGPRSASVRRTPRPDAHAPLSLRSPPSEPPETPSPPDRSSFSPTQTPSGEPPSLRRGPQKLSPDPAAPSQRDDPKREWNLLSTEALRWPSNRESWGSGPQMDALKEPSRGSRSLSRDRGPTDREENPSFPRPLNRGLSWPSTDRAPPPLSHGDGAGRDDEKNESRVEGGAADEGRHGNEVDDVRGYVVVQGPATRGSFSSYASSGRGSMETGNGRMSVCLSPTLSKAPDEIEEYTEDLAPHLDDARRSRKASVDESYEWDEDASQPETRQAQFQDPCASQELLKSASRRSLVSVQACSPTDCSQTALLRGCATNRCSPQVEMETVLF